MSLSRSRRQAGPSGDLTIPNEVSRTGLCMPVAQRGDALDPLYHSSSSFSAAASCSLPDLSNTYLPYSPPYTEQPLLESNRSFNLGYPCYFPDIPASSDSLELNDGFACYPSPSSLSTWMESSDNDLLTIHSPKPVFAYNIFHFNFDRPYSPEKRLPSPEPNCSRKRRRELSDICEDTPTSIKKQKIGRITSSFISLPHDPYFSSSSLYSPQISSTDMPPFTDFIFGKNTFGCTFNFELIPPWQHALAY